MTKVTGHYEFDGDTDSLAKIYPAAWYRRGVVPPFGAEIEWSTPMSLYKGIVRGQHNGSLWIQTGIGSYVTLNYKGVDIVPLGYDLKEVHQQAIRENEAKDLDKLQEVLADCLRIGGLHIHPEDLRALAMNLMRRGVKF